jgi:hypothetical protein
VAQNYVALGLGLKESRFFLLHQYGVVWQSKRLKLLTAGLCSSAFVFFPDHDSFMLPF